MAGGALTCGKGDIDMGRHTYITLLKSVVYGWRTS